ncbi:MAG: M23 family metallopeptidase [Sphingosinicella sp.]|nr:M23 family metallopeptidase [Sphingosinicella sp.]
MEAGNGGGAITLGPGNIHARPSISRGFGQRVEDLQRAADIDLLVDLGVRIGSAEWFRGALTILALCYAAVSLAPGLEPVAGAVPAALTEAQLDEARAFSFGPLAYGADTGRRMAATDAVRPLTDTPERPIIELTAMVGRGDGFARVLQRAGVSTEEAGRLEALIGGSIEFSDIKEGTPVALTLGRRADRNVARPLEALTFRARFDLKIEVNRAEGRLALARIPIAVDDTPLRIQGQVGSSLYSAARASGAPASAVQSYLRAIASQVNVGSLGAGDHFDIIIEHRRAETGETETGKLLYAGLERSGGKKIQMMQWNQGAGQQWFEASGVGKQSGMLQRPVPGSVSSNFGMRRHPILGYSRMHKGMDFRAGYGTPILAATDGRVARAGWAGGYGKQVRISHRGGLTTSYSHMSRIVAAPGQSVRQGQVIGYVGSTGLSTGPHLHYELYRNGTPVNPNLVKFTQRAQPSGSDLASFRSKLRGLLGVPLGSAKAQVRDAEAKTAAKSIKA